MSGNSQQLEARDQEIFVLSVKANKIIRTSVQNVHFDKNLGVAEITPDAAREFCRRNFPEQYQEFSESVRTNPETVYVDFEDILAGIEKTPAYSVLLEVIKKQRLDTLQDKAFVAGFIIVHHLRCHAMMNSMLEFSKSVGIEKFEYFWMLKHMLGNAHYLYRLVAPLVASKWILYRTKEHAFPLTDSPILVRSRNMMVALSPRLLLEINLKMPASEDEWKIKNSIKKGKLAEFRRRTIGNTFREIIFSDRRLLQTWRETPEFQRRVKLVSNISTYNAIVAKKANRELWKINAFGNLI